MSQHPPGLWAVIAASVVVMPTGSLPAQQAGGGSTPARVSAMAEHARSILVTGVGGPEVSAPIPLIAEPILRYDDKARNIFDATLWAWGPKGRPAAVLKVEDYPNRAAEVRWLYGIVSLSPDLIRVEGDDHWEWTSSRPGLEPRAIPGAPVPAATGMLRLSQMKSLARRFEAHEDAGPVRGRLQLRLMPQPVHRYSAPDSGLLDGAIFCFVYGTNPDLLIVLEASRQGDPSPSWHYGLARLGGGATFVSLDGREVWSQPGADPPARRETYMNRRQRDRAGP